MEKSERRRSSGTLLMLFLLVVSGCARVPGETSPVFGPSPSILSPETAGQGRIKKFPSATCADVSWSKDRRKMFYRMEGHGVGGEHDGPDEVLALARKEALLRVLRCSGERQILESFYDNTYVTDGKVGQAISRDLFETLDAFSRDETVFKTCRVAGKSLACTIRLQGWIRTETPDPAFSIRSFGMGRRGVFQDGEFLSIRFRLTRSARVYLFDVEKKGQTALLFPVPLAGRFPNPVPAGKIILYPPAGSRIRLRVRVPAGRTRTLERLVIVAIRKGRLGLSGRISQKKKGKETLYAVGDFQKEVLPRLYRLRGPGRNWTFREIPFEIVRSENP